MPIDGFAAIVMNHYNPIPNPIVRITQDISSIVGKPDRIFGKIGSPPGGSPNHSSRPVGNVNGVVPIPIPLSKNAVYLGSDKNPALDYVANPPTI